MKNTSETGHAKNVANFEQLISICTSYGTIYNPTKGAIKIPALNTLLTTAKNSLATTNSAVVPYNKAVNARIIAFTPLSKLITKILASLDATDASQQVVANAKTITRKLQGRRASAKHIPAPAQEGVDTPDTPKSISASHLSHDNQIENFSKLILLLTNEPLYVPNEAEIKVATLNTLLASLKTANTAVVNATIAAKTARISRNKVLYLPLTGLYDIQLEVKKYVKSIFGIISPEYKLISAVKFTKTM